MNFRPQGYYTDNEENSPVFFSNKDFNEATKDIFIPPTKQLSAIATTSGYKLSRKQERTLKSLTCAKAVYLLNNISGMSEREKADSFFEIKLFNKIRKNIKAVY